MIRRRRRSFAAAPAAVTVVKAGQVLLKSDYDAWRETEYLSRGANGRELRSRAAEMAAGEGVRHELMELDAEPRHEARVAPERL